MSPSTTLVLGACSIALACDTYSSRSPSHNLGDTALALVNTQLDFGPRNPGSIGHVRTGDWITERLRARADTVLVQRWRHNTKQGATLQLRNILARFEPHESDRVLFVTHWDTRPVADNDPDPANRHKPILGANDGASGVALLLVVADMLSKARPSVGVDLLFVDGEDYGDFSDRDLHDVLIGSRYFARHLPDSTYRPLYGVVWDMVGDRDLHIAQEGVSVQKAPEVVELVWQAAEQLGYANVFERRAGVPVTDDHVALLDAGLRVIDVVDLDYRGPEGQDYHHTLEDTADKVSARSLQVMADVAIGLVRRR